MKFEDQVCALELARRLYELGVKQDSLFYWERGYLAQITTDWRLMFGHQYNEYVSAFNVAELGEMLPNSVLLPGMEPFDNFRIEINKFKSVGDYQKITNNWIVSYECDTTHPGGVPWARRRLTSNIHDPNLANAMAKMLIYLIENKLIEVPV